MYNMIVVGMDCLVAVLCVQCTTDLQTPFVLTPHMDKINQIFDASTVEDIVEKLKADGSDWANEQLAILAKGVSSSRAIQGSIS